MNKSGPIIIIEDDLREQHLLGEVFRRLNLGNPVLFFNTGKMALDYLTESYVHPFLMLSDVNQPDDVVDLRKKMTANKTLKLKCVPYLFFSKSSQDKKAAIREYADVIQGFFVKPRNMDSLTKTIAAIVQYWSICEAPCGHE